MFIFELVPFPTTVPLVVGKCRRLIALRSVVRKWHGHPVEGSLLIAKLGCVLHGPFRPWKALRQDTVPILYLNWVVDVNSSLRSTKGGCDSSPSEPRPARVGRAFLFRVLRAALPLQLLLLLLIGLTCLVPMSEEDYSCALSNNFARSFHPMLRYTNGPPPLWSKTSSTQVLAAWGGWGPKQPPATREEWDLGRRPLVAASALLHTLCV